MAGISPCTAQTAPVASRLRKSTLESVSPCSLCQEPQSGSQMPAGSHIAEPNRESHTTRPAKKCLPLNGTRVDKSRVPPGYLIVPLAFLIRIGFRAPIACPAAAVKKPFCRKVASRGATRRLKGTALRLTLGYTRSTAVDSPGGVPRGKVVKCHPAGLLCDGALAI